MNRFNACYAVSLLISAGLLAGCASAPAPEASEDNAVVVNELATAPLAGDSELRVERRAGESAFEMVNAPGWRTIQPGVWEHGEGESKRQVIVGEAGHQWLAEQTTQQIDALQAKIKGGDPAESLSQQIEQLEQVNARAQTALAGEREIKAPTPSAASCDLSLYTGPSGPVFAVSGAAALAQAVCSGGCVAFTVTSQACCAGVCAPLTTQTNTVCSSPLLMGSLLQGSGFGSASVTITPPSISQSNASFLCN
jgi:hypothetical protein